MDKIISAVSQLVEALTKFRITLVISIAGFLLLLISFFEVQNLTITTTEKTNFVSLFAGIACLAFSVWAELKFRDSPKKVEDRAYQITRRRFANLIYIYTKESKKIALGRHEKIGFLPPGRRLGLYEPPDEELESIVLDQFGLEVTAENFVSLVIKPQTTSHTDENGQHMGETQFRISPIWVQLERHPLHRPDEEIEVEEHLDFVFLCLLEKEAPLNDGSRRECDWFDRNALSQMIKPNHEKKTPVDILRGFDAIEDFLSDDKNA